MGREVESLPSPLLIVLGTLEHLVRMAFVLRFADASRAEAGWGEYEIGIPVVIQQHRSADHAPSVLVHELELV